MTAPDRPTARQTAQDGPERGRSYIDATFVLGAVLAAAVCVLIGLWLGGGRRVPEDGVAFREPFDPEYEVTGV